MMGERDATTFPKDCSCCVPGAQDQRLCQQCFMIWYDAGITEANVLAREARWRKAGGRWPWGAGQATVAQLEALGTQPLPDLVAEKREKWSN